MSGGYLVTFGHNGLPKLHHPECGYATNAKGVELVLFAPPGTPFCSFCQGKPPRTEEKLVDEGVGAPYAIVAHDYSARRLTVHAASCAHVERYVADPGRQFIRNGGSSRRRVWWMSSYPERATPCTRCMVTVEIEPGVRATSHSVTEVPWLHVPGERFAIVRRGAGRQASFIAHIPDISHLDLPSDLSSRPRSCRRIHLETELASDGARRLWRVKELPEWMQRCTSCFFHPESEWSAEPDYARLGAVAMECPKCASNNLDRDGSDWVCWNCDWMGARPLVKELI